MAVARGKEGAVPSYSGASGAARGGGSSLPTGGGDPALEVRVQLAVGGSPVNTPSGKPSGHFGHSGAAASDLTPHRKISPAHPPLATTPTCDVLIAGGSTAALAAALTAANTATSTTSSTGGTSGRNGSGNGTVHVCLTEPTDVLGGQLSYNPAIDFGAFTHLSPGVEWAAMVDAVTDAHSACWVSRSCFPPQRLAAWANNRIALLPNLHVLFRTTVARAVRDGATGNVVALVLVTRRPKDPMNEWAPRLSEVVRDWYSTGASVVYDKVVQTVHAKVVVEATELGDVLGTASLPHTQGVEQPTEASLSTDDGISQSVCFPFFVEALPSNHTPSNGSVPRGSAWVSAGAEPYWGAAPDGSCCCGDGNSLPPDAHTCKGHPSTGSCLYAGQCSWGGVWRYRRSTRGSGAPLATGVNVGDVTMQNWGHGNDMPAANIYLPSTAAAATASNGTAPLSPHKPKAATYHEPTVM